MENAYYWFGEDRSRNNHPGKHPVACYSSVDLVNWTFRNQFINLAAPSNFGEEWVIERPKVFYNAMTGKYVMYVIHRRKHRRGSHREIRRALLCARLRAHRLGSQSEQIRHLTLTRRPVEIGGGIPWLPEPKDWNLNIITGETSLVTD